MKKKLGDIVELMRNSFYANMMENLGCHKSTKFTCAEIGWVREINEFTKAGIIKTPFQCDIALNRERF